MQRLYVPFPLQIDLSLDDMQVHHQLTRVLRLQVGDMVTLFDGDGSETVYQITHIDKRSIQLRGQNRIFPHTEPNRHITLYQALPNKYEKIEYIIQKGVEVGIREFIFFRSDRSQKLLITPHKKERFTTIMIEALEQCGGVVLPTLRFVDVVPAIDPTLQHFFLNTRGQSMLLRDLSPAPNIGVWVGPEGGWSGDEHQKMVENGCISVRFGERVLRTETMGIVASFGLLNV